MHYVKLKGSKELELIGGSQLSENSVILKLMIHKMMSPIHFKKIKVKK